jgi:pulcherriminic acid synthase
MSDATYVEPDEEPLPAAGYRTYEVYQRERVGESTDQLTPRELIGDEMLGDPFRLLTILREQDPCYRDWIGNRFWITRYDDVTSVFADEANFESRSKRWFSGQPTFGRDLGNELPVLWAHANRIDAHVEAIVERMLHELVDEPDLAVGFAARLPLELWRAVLDLPPRDLAQFAVLSWRMQRSAGWHEADRCEGRDAMRALVRLIEPLVEQRRTEPGDDLISAALSVEVAGHPIDATDIVATIFEADHETLHGGLANLWFQLLTQPDQLDVVRSEHRLMKQGWHEVLRHSPPVHTAKRFARHEVERFGRLLPDGALLTCSAAAANRDPRVFSAPDAFSIQRSDLCQREPRGQYRADGLPSGIAFGLGRPSVHPAVPRERPRSRYALVRDVAVTASRMLLEAYPEISLAADAQPVFRSLRLGEMYTCWELPVALNSRSNHRVSDTE